ncbi:MAG: cache domain-containing protein [bacterium]|nr:cache domain-containing protein [bacterium]
MIFSRIKQFDLRPFVVLFLLLIGAGCSHSASKSIKESTFKRLSKIKKEKKAEVLRYFQGVMDKSYAIVDDGKMVRLFNEIKAKPTLLAMQKLIFDMDVHFVTEYSDFYDILFVDESGFIFHSIKQESDYHTNLFSGRWAGSHLAKQLREDGEKQFVDYGHYGPSDEPAAFFVTPLEKAGKRSGWIVLQAPINKVNSILSDHGGLGRTGEVYLVNRGKLMLTDSRFVVDSTILKQKVDTEAVRLAFEMKEGQKVIEDYRRVRVFSAFEKFKVFNNEWIIIVEIDEDEVITENYKGHKKYYLGGVMKEVMVRNKARSTVSSLWNKKNGKRADVSEFCMTRSGELLETSGVGPCTSIVVYLPRKFGYLSHISPVDDIYNKGLMERLYLRDRNTSFLSKIMKKIKNYEMYPSELKELKIAVVATHLESLETVIDDLIGMDIGLAQIKVMINPYADYANVRFDQSSDDIGVQWRMRSTSTKDLYESVDDVANLGAVIKKVAGYET